jgi:hypothetical protein
MRRAKASITKAVCSTNPTEAESGRRCCGTDPADLVTERDSHRWAAFTYALGAFVERMLTTGGRFTLELRPVGLAVRPRSARRCLPRGDRLEQRAIEPASCLVITGALRQIASARTVAAGHAFVQNLRRGRYELTADLPAHDRVRVAFADLALTLTGPDAVQPSRRAQAPTTQQRRRRNTCRR